MRITLIADARSPIARGWIHAVAEEGHDLQVLSTYPVTPSSIPGRLELLPAVPVLVNLSPVVLPIPRPRERPRSSTGGLMPPGSRSMAPGAKRLRDLRLFSEKLCQPWVSAKIKRSITTFQPDLIHALRIPFEGILTEPAARNLGQPFIVSIWGNDLTLFAAGSRWLRRSTKRVLDAAVGLHCDCERDVRLARALGYAGRATVLPTCGGLDESVFPGLASRRNVRMRLGIDSSAPVIFDPRASRGYTRHDIFFAALPAILNKYPNAVIVTVGVDHDSELRNFSRELRVQSRVIFLPNQSAHQMADLYAASDVMVSPTEHDGTPNSLLEGMACGCFPIVSDLESLREWVDHGVNGFVVELSSESFQNAVIKALGDRKLRSSAALQNRNLIGRRATRAVVKAEISGFYRDVLTGATAPTGRQVR